MTRRIPSWLAGLVVTAAVYGVAVGQEALGLLPPWNWWSAPGCCRWAPVGLQLRQRCVDGVDW